MPPTARGRNYWSLIIPILIAAAYRTWFYFRPRLTGNNKLDGLLGVALGLYICSQAAANLLDMLLYSRHFLIQGASTRSNVLWLAANILAEIIGFMTVFFALTQFFR